MALSQAQRLIADDWVSAYTATAEPAVLPAALDLRSGQRRAEHEDIAAAKVACETQRPLTWVPLELRSSRTLTPERRFSRIAWRRETDASSRCRSAPGRGRCASRLGERMSSVSSGPWTSM